MDCRCESPKKRLGGRPRDDPGPVRTDRAARGAEGDGRRRTCPDRHEHLYQAVIDAELTAVIGAGSHQRTDTRPERRNGSRPRLTTAGTWSCRSSSCAPAPFLSSLLERRRRDRSSTVRGAHEGPSARPEHPQGRRPGQGPPRGQRPEQGPRIADHPTSTRRSRVPGTGRSVSSHSRTCSRRRRTIRPRPTDGSSTRPSSSASPAMATAKSRLRRRRRASELLRTTTSLRQSERPGPDRQATGHQRPPLQPEGCDRGGAHSRQGAEMVGALASASRPPPVLNHHGQGEFAGVDHEVATDSSHRG